MAEGGATARHGVWRGYHRRLAGGAPLGRVGGMIHSVRHLLSACASLGARAHLVRFLLAAGCAESAPAQITETRGLRFAYDGPAEFVYPWDGRHQSIRFTVANTAGAPSGVYALRIAVNGATNEFPGYAHFPNGSNFTLGVGEAGRVSCWAQGVYENLGPTPPPATGESKDYTFDFIFTEATRPIAQADTFTITQKVRFTNLGDAPTLAGPLTLRGSVRFAGAAAAPAGVAVEIATPYSPRWYRLTTTVAAAAPAGAGVTVAQGLPARDDWYVRVSAPGYASRLVRLAEVTSGGVATLDLVLAAAAPPSLSYRLATELATPTGFWRGAVSESEGTFVAFPGQENWRTGATDAETRSYREAARIYKYRFDGTKIWEHAPGWEIWGGDMTPDGRYVAYALNPTQTNFYQPTEFKLVLLDGTTGATLWTKTANARDQSAASDAKKLESLEVALSPDGRYVAVGSTGSGQVSLLDRATGAFLWSTSGAAAASFGQVRHLRFAADSAHLYAGSGDNFLRKLRTTDGAVVWKALVGGWPFVNGLGFSPDGAIITTGAKSFDTAGVRDSDGQVLWLRHTQYFDSVPAPGGAVTTTFNGVIYRLADGAIQGMTKSSALSAYTPDGANLLRVAAELSLHDLTGVKLATFAKSGLSAGSGEQPQWCYATKDGRYVIGLGRDMDRPGKTGIAIWERTSAAVGAPTIDSQPASRTAVAGESVTLSVAASGPGALTYQWSKDGVALAGRTAATLTLAAVTAADAGAYLCTVSNPGGSVTSAVATLTVTADAPRLSNLAVRAPAGPGAATLIVGFVVGGAGTNGTKPLLLRGAGPSLAAFGVGDAMADPRLSLLRNGAEVAGNDDWGGTAALSALVAATGAFPFAGAGSRDAAVAFAASGGAYSMLVTGAAAGQALAEIYETGGTPASTAPRLVNLSTRTDVVAGGTLIVGFTVAGGGGLPVLVRAAGPGLAGFGVTGALGDPQLMLLRGATTVAANDNWSAAANAGEVAAAAARVGAFALAPGSRDAALLATLTPGGYTVQVVGVAGATGTVLVEVYEAP